MAQSSNSKNRIAASRRTGIDRRWIPSAGHTPERRRGEDRRKPDRQPFLKSFDDNDADEARSLFPQIDDDAESPSSPAPLSDGDTIALFAPDQLPAGGSTADKD